MEKVTAIIWLLAVGWSFWYSLTRVSKMEWPELFFNLMLLFVSLELVSDFLLALAKAIIKL